MTSRSSPCERSTSAAAGSRSTNTASARTAGARPSTASSSCARASVSELASIVHDGDMRLERPDDLEAGAEGGGQLRRTVERRGGLFAAVDRAADALRRDVLAVAIALRHHGDGA